MAEQLGLEAILSVYDNGFSKGLQNAERRVSSFDKTIDSLSMNISSGLSDGLVSFGNAVDNMGSKLTNSITKPALVAGTALAGLTVGKGFGRLVGIDSARAKLQGLGHDAKEVDAIMENALESVSGTSFAMEDAANTAATAVAAGITPGKELTRYLTLTADAAAIAGSDMGEMGSIFNKIATSGVIQAEEMNQMGDRGIPIFQMLADTMNVSADEVKKLGSQGEISSAVFLNAVENGFGGAAKTMGDMSFSASLDNIGAAISRIGANFLDAGGDGGGFFSQLKPLMSEFRESLGVIEERAAELGVKFGEAFANAVDNIREAVAWFKELDSGIQDTIIRSAGIGTALAVGIGPALQIVGPLLAGLGAISGIASKGSSSITSLGNGITNTLGGAVGGITAKLGDLKGSLDFSGFKMPNLFAKSEMAVPDPKPLLGMVDALKSIKGMDEVSSGRLTENFGTDDSFFDNLTEYMSSTEAESIGVPDKLLDSILEGREGLEEMVGSMDKLGDSTEAVGGKSGGFISMLGSMKDKALPAVAAVGGAVSGIAGVTLQGVQMLLKASLAAFNITAVVGVVLVGMGYLYDTFQTQIDSVINLIIEKGPGIVQGFANSIVEAIPELITSGVEMFSRLVEVIMTMGPVLLTAGMDIITTLVQGVIMNMPAIMDGMALIFSFIVTSIAQHLPTIIIMGAEVLIALVDGLIANQNLVFDSVGTLLNAFMVIIVQALPMIFTLGLMILGFLVDGIVANMDMIIATVVTLITILIVEIANSLPEIISAGLDILVAIVNGIIDNKDLIIESGMLILDTLIGLIVEELPSLIIAGMNILLWIIQGIVENLDTIILAAISIVMTLIGALLTAIRDNWREILSVGSQIAAAIVIGLADALINGFIGVLNEILKWVNNKFKLNIKLIDEVDFYDPEKIQKDMNQTFKVDPSIGDVDGNKRGPSDSNAVSRLGGGMPANINLNMGGQEYDSFTGNIYDNNESNIRLKENY